MNTTLPPERTYRDHVDMACAAFADDNAALLDELRETRADRDAYRALAVAALDCLRKITRERDQLRRTIGRWLTERRHSKSRRIAA